MPTTAAEVAALVGGTLHGPDRAWTQVAPLHRAREQDLAFHDKGDPGAAGVLLTRAPLPGRTCVVVADPLAAMCTLIERLWPEDHPGAVERDGVIVYPGVVWPDDERIEVGVGTVLFPNVVLYPMTRIGSRCRIHAGTVVGADGFRYHGGRRVPHPAGVTIGDDCDIGANCTIDRGFLEDTVLGDRCRLDDQVHVGHNVRLGDDVYVAAQTGISGSVTIGSGTVIGGQVGVADHASIGRNVRIGAQSGVHGTIADGEAILGTPAQPLARMRRIYAALRYLPDLVRKA